MNRVTQAIAAARTQIANRLRDGLITADQVEDARKQLDMGLDEYVKFQEMKSLAVTSQRLTLDEGMTIYGYLGESGPENFNRQPIEVKHVLTKIFSELLADRIKAA